MSDNFSIQNNNLPKSVPRKTNIFLILAIVAIFLGVVGLLGYLYGVSTNASIRFLNLSHPATSSTQPGQNSGKITSNLAVTWQQPEKIPSLNLFFTDTAAFNSSTPPVNFGTTYATYYKVGSTVDHVSDIIYVSVQYDGPGGSTHLLLERTGSKLAVLQKYSDISTSTPVKASDTSQGAVDADGMFIGTFTLDTTTSIPELDFPSTITTTNPRQLLKLDTVHGYDAQGLWISNPANEKLLSAFTDPVWGQVFTATTTNGFYLVRGPLVAVYAYKPDFYDQDFQIPAITFDNGQKNIAAYNFTSVSGCGSINYSNIISTSTLSVERDLVAIGKTSQGDALYELKDKQNSRLKSLYSNYGTTPTSTYEVFLASHPLLYWVDPFGRLTELQNAQFAPQAECGKPVIYLYPKVTMPVSVKLFPQGGFTFSDPPYNAGWDVVAEPNGTLHIGFSSSSYPFLFWEGRGGLYEEPKTGWVVARSNIKNFLTVKLHQLGLNKKESADFLSFWLPRMQAKPYYFVTFMGNKTMDTLAPLVIDPAPDTVIRILMDYTELDHPIFVKPYTIITPARKGFTVVEWGGVLR